MRSYRWKAEQEGGLEHLQLDAGLDGVRAEGGVIGLDAGMPFGCSYAIQCDARWQVRRVELHVALEPALRLDSDGAGHWHDADGRPVPALAGCIDVDLTCTPFTNTLPIRRLDGRLARRQEIEVAYIDVPRLDVGPSRQAYTRLGPGRYLFESLSNPFSAAIETDEDGLVLRYPGLFARA